MTIAGRAVNVSVVTDLTTWLKAADGHGAESVRAQNRLIAYFINKQLANPPYNIANPYLEWSQIDATEVERFATTRRPAPVIRQPPGVTIEGDPNCLCLEPGKLCIPHDVR